VPGVEASGAGSQKKTLHACERDTPRVQSLRQSWRKEVDTIEPQKLVFIDESGATTSMTRTRGRARRGERVTGAVPQGHWKVLTMLGALRASGIAAASSVLSATDGEIFRLFVTEALVPVLRRGDVVVMDNLGAHKVSGVCEAIEQAGARVLYLPPYSPDFSPIEPCWSKVKEAMRSAAARTPERLGEAASDAFKNVSRNDARGWFDHCGYVLH
jgi:transposase